MSEKNEWFDKAGGLAFSCTQCGNCCSGSSGYVLASDEEIKALADRFGLSLSQFKKTYMHQTSEGLSLKEKPSPAGLDCVFLDRETRPGKIICSVYDLRPAQCRTWPFWHSNLTSPRAWERAKKTCPGLDRGNIVPPEQIRITRAVVKI